MPKAGLKLTIPETRSLVPTNDMRYIGIAPKIVPINIATTPLKKPRPDSVFPAYIDARHIPAPVHISMICQCDILSFFFIDTPPASQ